MTKPRPRSGPICHTKLTAQNIFRLGGPDSYFTSNQPNENRRHFDLRAEEAGRKNFTHLPPRSPCFRVPYIIFTTKVCISQGFSLSYPEMASQWQAIDIDNGRALELLFLQGSWTGAPRPPAFQISVLDVHSLCLLFKCFTSVQWAALIICYEASRVPMLNGIVGNKIWKCGGMCLISNSWRVGNRIAHYTYLASRQEAIFKLKQHYLK